MKKELIILLLSFSSFCYSQTESGKIEKRNLVWTEMTCEKGTKEAEADFNKGVYNSYSYGFVVKTTPKGQEGFNEFYKEYIFQKYSINIEHRGCVVSNQSECYSKTMENLILKKFGKNIFEKARKEALILFTQK